MRSVATPWRGVLAVATAAPHDVPALWSDGRTTLLAWPGEPASPGIRLIRAEPGASPKAMTLGRLPRSVALFPADYGNLHILWLDQTPPGEAFLAGAVINTEGAIKRDPDTISKTSATQYSAVSTKNGEVAVLWVEAGERARLMAQRIDNGGRSLQAIQLGQNATRPATAVDLRGGLHLAWLESAGASIWTIRYLYLPGGDLPESAPATGASIGVIRLEPGWALDHFVLAADQGRIYCLWSAVQVGGFPAQGAARLDGFAFVIGDSASTLKLSVLLPENANIRWPTRPNRAQPALLLGVVLSLWDGNHWIDQPATLTFNPDGGAAIQPFYVSLSGSRETLNGLALATTADNVIYQAWTALDTDGKATVYFSTTR